MKTVSISIITIGFVIAGYGQSPFLVSPEGGYLGNLNENPWNLNSVANPYGRYGSRYSYDSVNNPYGPYGSAYSINSPNNPYSTHGAPRIYSPDGQYLGRLSRNPYNLESTGNPSGVYGSSSSLNSINNPNGEYGSEYSPKSTTYLYGNSHFKERKEIYPYTKPIYSTLDYTEPSGYKNEPTEQQSYITDILLQQNPYLRSTLNKNKAMFDAIAEVKTASTSPLHMTTDSNEINALSKEFDEVISILQKHKETLFAYSLAGSFEEVKEYVIPVNEYDGLQEGARQAAQYYVEKMIEDFKDILLQKE